MSAYGSARDHHQPCACGAELEDECPRCASSNPFGSMRIVRADGCPCGAGFAHGPHDDWDPEAVQS